MKFVRVLIVVILMITANTHVVCAQKTEGGREMKTALVAGGCFWCMESDFEKLTVLDDVTSGYANGSSPDPTYHDYVEKGYIEAVKITYDPEIILYTDILEYFLKHIDPVDAGGQFCDRGYAYAPAIFYQTDAQKKSAEEILKKVKESGILKAPVAVKLLEFKNFYPAEDYHQNYYKKNVLKYKFYRFNCRRDKRVKEVWGKFKNIQGFSMNGASDEKPSKEKLKEILTPLQYKVTQEEGTEPPFNNEYWDNKAQGIYVDIVSGEPLFSSTHKFKSGTGWPSFTQPLEPNNIVEKEDRSLFSVRTEVRSKDADSHLGHIFEDGPAPTGLRYCINSAALKFIPKEKLQEEGYGEYEKLFN